MTPSKPLRPNGLRRSPGAILTMRPTMSSALSSKLRRALAAVLLLALAGLAVRALGAARLERADFVMNNGAEVTTLDPATITGVPEGRVAYALFEGLTVKDPRTLEPLPGVAESWSVSPDGRTYTFRIRPTARWSDGSALTAQDFLWSWERLLDPATAAEYAHLLWCVVGAEPYTTLPDAHLLVPGAEHGLWVQELAGGRTRLGLSGFLLDTLAPAAAVERLAAAGEMLPRGAPLVRVDGRELRLPFAATLLSWRPSPAPTVAALSADPWEAGWLAEVEPAPGALAAAVAEERLLSARRFREEFAWPELVGLAAPAERELVVRLKVPTAYFVNLTGFYPLFPVSRRSLEQARARWPDTWQVEWVRPENLVTNGPFLLQERRINDRIRLVKNPGYWDADNVAFRTLDMLAIEHYGTMLNLYLTGEVDWIDRITPNLVPRLIQREDFRPEPYLGTYFFRVNVGKPPLDDRRVRHALALTLDRRAICEKVMKAGQIPSWSLVPHGFAAYDRPELEHAPVAPDLGDYDRAFAADCARAARLLAEAGYGPGAKELPTIEIHHNTSEAHRDIAEVVADSWRRHLGLDAKLLNQEWKVYLDTQNRLGYDVSRSSWVGDYLDPNTFLDVFVSGGENNRTGWGDPRYDELIERARHEPDAAARLGILRQAEELLLEELPILPVFTYVTQNVRKPRLGGFFENLQDDHYPKFWYWMDDAELAETRAAYGAARELVEPGGPPAGLYSPAAQRARRR